MKHDLKIFGLSLCLIAVGACGDDDDDDGIITGTETETGNGDGTGTTGDGEETGTAEDTATTGDAETTTGEETGTAGTAGGTDTGTAEGTTGGEEDASVRAMHLGVNIPAVDVFANMMGPVFEDLVFGDSTEYATVPAGDNSLQVAVADMPVEDAALDETFTLDPNTLYTAVAIGDLMMTDAAPGPQLIAIVDDDADIDPEEVRIQAVHAAPAVGLVDVQLFEADAMDPLETLEDVEFGGAGTFADAPAGMVVVGVDIFDDSDTLVGEVDFDVDASGAGGAYVNAYVTNDEMGDPLLVLQLPDGTTETIMPVE